MPRAAFRIIPPIQWMGLFSLLWSCPSELQDLCQAASTKITIGKWHIGRQSLENLFTFSRSDLVPTSVKIILDMGGRIPACSGRYWTTRGWLYKILARALSHPWYRTEPLSRNKGFLFAPVRWRLMSPSWLFRFYTKGLFCMSGWSKQNRKGRKLSLQHISACSNSVIAIGSSKGCRKLRTEENVWLVKLTLFEESLGICQLCFIQAF